MRHRLTASAPGYVPGLHFQGEGAGRIAGIDLRAGTETRGVDLVLEDGGVEIRGIVRDLSGGPIEGAQIVTERAFTRSDSEGAFSLWVRPGPQSVVADAEGYAPSLAEGIAPSRSFELFLSPEAVLLGKVVRVGSGEPVEGATVRSGSQEWGGNHAVLTDSGGNFRIAGLQPGVYKPTAEADDARGRAVEQVVLGIGETSATIVIEAHPAFTVEGRVLVVGGGSCHHGWVSLQDPTNARGVYASVEGDGDVRVPALLPGTYAVSLGCIGHLAEESYDPITVVDRSLLGLTWKVARGQSIRGKVVDQAGNPVAGIEVQAWQRLDPSRPRGRQTWARGTTDSEGRFELGGLLAGQFDVSVVGGRAKPRMPTTVTLKGDQDLADVRIELPAAGEVRGTVLDERGRPIARTTVSLSGGPQPFVTMVSDDGSFQIPHVAAGTYEVLAAGPWGELRQLDPGPSSEPVKVEAGRITSVKLVVEASAGTISGSVREADGGAVDDAFVESIRESGDEEPTEPAMRGAPWGDFFGAPNLTEADGRFTLRGLPAAKYTIRAYRKGGGEGFVEHVEPGSDIVVTLGATGRLAGTVRVPGGAPPDEFSLEVVDTATGFRRRDTFFRTGGAWSVPELPAGRYRIQVHAGSATAQSEASVREGADTTDVEIELTPKVSVQGSVIDATGAAIAGVQVFLRSAQGGPSNLLDEARRYVTDASGRFELTDAPTGEVELVLVRRGPGADGTVETTKVPLKISSAAPTVELGPVRWPGMGAPTSPH